MSTHVRQTCHYQGRVQGVGFRFATRQVAQRYRVAGYVQNLSDGRVLVVAEGEKAEIDRFLSDLDQRMTDYISDVQMDTSPATGEFVEFGIRH